MQRCGSPLGWAGVCHQEDGVIFETGEHIDLRGGYHQSCDLRKSFGGVPIGVIGLLRYAMNERPLWDQGCIDDEIHWALDYYLKTVQPNGCVYNTLNAPLGWEGRVFFASGAPASAQWNVLSILLLGARIFADDPCHSDRLLDAAQRIWDYMTRPDRSYEPYHHPSVLPRGMDAEFFYHASFRDSTSDLCGRLAAAAAFYRLTGAAKWRNEIEKTANDLCSCFVGDHLEDNIAAGCLRLQKDDLQLMECTVSYGWTAPGIQALFDAIDVMPEAASAGKWRAMAGLIAEQRAMLARKDPWRRVGSFISRESWMLPSGHPALGYKPTVLGDAFSAAKPAGFVSDSQGRQSQCYYK
ncbi:MAG: glycoside hydrolase family 9 protein, partial [Clostridia bacterium]